MKEKKGIDIIKLYSTVLGEKVKEFDLPPPSFSVMKAEIIDYDKEKKTRLTFEVAVMDEDENIYTTAKVVNWII